MKKLIVFDLDGTLWDSTHQVIWAWNEILAVDYPSLEPITAEGLHDLMGLPVEEIVHRLFPVLSHDEVLELMTKVSEHENEILAREGGELYPGVAEGLPKLAEVYDIAIVSNCERGYIESFLTAHHMAPYIRDHESHGGTGLSKGQNIRLVMERLGEEEIVYVGDTASDQRACMEAQVPFLWVRWGFGRDLESKGSFGSFPELVDYFLAEGRP